MDENIENKKIPQENKENEEKKTPQEGNASKARDKIPQQGNENRKETEKNNKEQSNENRKETEKNNKEQSNENRKKTEKNNKKQSNENHKETEKNNKEQRKNGVKKAEKTHKAKTKSTVCIVSISVLVLILLIVSVIFSLININNENILSNISIMGINVGNMSKDKAKEAVSAVVNKKLEEELILKKDEYETNLNAKQINANFDVETAVNEAFNIGRDGNIVTNNYGILSAWLFGRNVDCAFSYEEDVLNKKIDDISAKLPGAVVQNSYYIEDDELIIVKGKDGLAVKKDELQNNILKQIQDINHNYVLIEIPTREAKPDKINIEQIKNEIYKEPQDAYVSKNPTTVHTHVNGVDFAITLEEAEKLLNEDKEEYVIPLKITIPEKTLSDLGEEAFPDELGTYTTRYDPTNRNRSNNLEISAKKINGTIVMPGETFSYNQTVGERTIAEGYKEAGAYSGGKVVQDVGGGICQTSSTLYNAVLYANLEIVDRSNHQFLTSYVSAGRDATVAWGAIDFQFKNTREYPIKIEAEVENGVCTMSIYGIKEKSEYEVVIQPVVLSYIPYTTKYEDDATLEEGKEVVEQSGYTGCTSETYKILKQNGEVISKTLLSKDTYDPMTRIVRRGTKKAQDVNADIEDVEKNNENT